MPALWQDSAVYGDPAVFGGEEVGMRWLLIAVLLIGALCACGSKKDIFPLTGEITNKNVHTDTVYIDINDDGVLWTLEKHYYWLTVESDQKEFKFKVDKELYDEVMVGFHCRFESKSEVDCTDRGKPNQ